MTELTVVIPAHDEAALIERAVRAVSHPSIDVVVVANGCADDTAERSRNAGARTIELVEGSKIGALNAAIREVGVFPVAFVDADVVVSGQTLLTLAERLADAGALVASPRLIVRPSRSLLVRQYYRVWALTDYRTTGHIGSGVYMLSREGMVRLGVLPDVIADDLYVQRHFAPREKSTPDDVTFEVEAPASLSSLIGRNTRIAAGNRQLASRYPDLAPPPAASGARALLGRVWRRPRLWGGFFIYTVVYATVQRRAAKLLTSQHPITWTRDETTRSGDGQVAR